MDELIGSRSRHWYACSEPERPTDPWVVWHYRDCLGCTIKATAVTMMFPDDVTTNRVLANLMGWK